MLLQSLLSGKPQIKEDLNQAPQADYRASYGYHTGSGEYVTVHKAQTIATAYRAKNIISDDVAKGRALGASGHLVKPVNRDLLLGLLAQVHRPAGRGTLANGKEGEGGSYANEAAA